MSDVPIRGSRTVVTGASGFLGAHLCERLLDCGAIVHATSRIRRTSHHPKLTWWRSDLIDHGTVLEMLGEIRPDVVFHLAGQVTAVPDLALVLPTFHSLLTSTVNILLATESLGCRRLVISGSLTELVPGVPEAIPGSPYAAAKWMGTVYARMFHELYHTPAVILRPFMTYGPGQHKDKIVPYVILSLLQGNRPTLSSGKWEADWIYVDDVIDGFVQAASRTGIDGRTIDLGSGMLTSTAEVVKKLVSLINPEIEPLFGGIPDRPAEEIRVADTSSSKASLGWEPRTSLEQGLAKTIEWCRDQVNQQTGTST